MPRHSRRMIEPVEKPPQIFVTHVPDPTAVHRPNHLPILSIQTDNLNGLGPPSTSPNGLANSPSQKIRLTYPKRKYSHSRHDSLAVEPIPVFTKDERRLTKKGPSSPTTVLTMAGLFVCGLTLMLSGIIVLIQQADDRPFVIAGSIFLAVGVVMILCCAILQRKNVVKYILDLNRDLYFLRMGNDSYMSKLMMREDEDSDLPQPSFD